MNDKVKYIFVLGVFIILSIIGYFLLPQDEIVIQSSDDRQIETEYIFVHIEGCVQSPGLFKVEKGTRLYELIDIAGGETESADLSKINLASILVDTQKIYVPPIIMYSENSKDNTNTYQSNLVNINTATSAELQTLSGIGPSMAERIIKYREQNGFFIQIEDIMNVEGIGESKFNKIKENITI